MDSLAKDLKLSFRLLARTPGFSLAAIAVLGLGIGLNTGTFSVIHGLAFSARPFPEPDRVGVLAHNLTVVGVGERQETRRAFSAIVSSKLLRRARRAASLDSHDKYST